MSEPRVVVFFVNPPNSNDLDADDVGKASDIVVSKGIQHTDWANFPHLGILSLASYVDALPGFEGCYVDGVIRLFSKGGSVQGCACRTRSPT